MFNRILVSYKLHALWRRYTVIAILKPGKCYALTKNYRPIFFLCHTHKLSEMMILNRLNPPIKQLSTSWVQARTFNHRTTFESVTSAAQGEVRGTVFVELSEFYDVVNHKLLPNKIFKITYDVKFTYLMETYPETDASSSN